MRIIAIDDDDPITRETLKSSLQDEGFDILTARDAERFVATTERWSDGMTKPCKDGATRR